MNLNFKKRNLAAALTVALVAPALIAAPGSDNGHHKGHVKEHPLGKKQDALRLKALEAKLNGKAHGKTHEVAKGQFVELERTGEDTIWTLLVEFNNMAHNSLPEPDRDIDNSTIWTEDFSREYYLDILFSEEPGANSMRNFYIEQSSNRYTVNGDVTDWVTLPADAEYYDDDNYTTIGPGVWAAIQDGVNEWCAQGNTLDPSVYDVWDRYDFDGDGDFNEPDGYLDHFQIVHAGEGEEAGGGVLGGAAIWSHRWYARFNLIGAAGPSVPGNDDNLLGGIDIPCSDLWIGDYTVEPENGGVGVFAHEFAHDLGLPDLYDTNGGRNSTGFWTLMSSGSWLSDGTEDIGSKPGHMGGWEKFQLGWYNYEVAFAGEHSVHKLGPAATNTKQAQGVFVVLPQKEVTEQIGAPFEGEYFYYSGAGDDLDNLMYFETNLPANSTFRAMVNYEIEYDWDYAYLVISTDGGNNWENVWTDHSTNDDPNGQNFGAGIMGSTGGAWVPLTADLSAYEGDVMIGFRYWTDVAYVESGLMVDNMQINDGPALGAEMEEGVTLAGFRVSTGTETGLYSHYYLAELRNYYGYDDTLRTGPYNFGFIGEPGGDNWTERFPYQDGLLISYWDTFYGDNNTSTHPGGGLILPIDAHPELTFDANGQPWRPRIQSFDSTFSLEATDEITLHTGGMPSTIPSRPGNSVFNDLETFWTPAHGGAGVAVPKTGTTISIRSTSAHGNFMQIDVR